MAVLFILNESKNSEELGDISYYSTLESLILNIEPIDVINNEYFSYCLDGRELYLSATHEFGIVQTEFEAQANHRELVKKLILLDLARFIDKPKFGVDSRKINEAVTLEDAIKLIPKIFFNN